jgi:hypothetical protein
LNGINRFADSIIQGLIGGLHHLPGPSSLRGPFSNELAGLASGPSLLTINLLAIGAVDRVVPRFAIEAINRFGPLGIPC